MDLGRDNQWGQPSHKTMVAQVYHKDLTFLASSIAQPLDTLLISQLQREQVERIGLENILCF